MTSATATAANAKQLAAIEAVAAKVTATENELKGLEERAARHAVALCVALWRHTCRSRAATPINASGDATDADGDVNTTAAAAPATATAATAQRFAVDFAALRRAAYDLRMGTHWRDEALMQALFALDNVFGDDAVKGKRKEQVTRIKGLIARAEQLRVRNRRLDALLKRLPAPAVEEATANAAPAVAEQPAPAAAAADTKAQAEPMDTAPTPTAAAKALPTEALDVKHAPQQAAAMKAAAAAPEVPARPVTPPAAAAAAAAAAAPKARPATPPKTPPKAAPAASDDDEAAGFVIPAKVKAQWPRLRPEFDTRDAGDSIQLSAALPGVLPQDLGVSLSADNAVLTVRGLKRPSAQPQRRRAPALGGWFGYGYDDDEEDDAVEDDFGWFEEQFTIPARLGLDITKAERILRGGRLTIILPRKAAPRPASAAAASPRCYPAAAAATAPQYYRQPQAAPNPFAGFGGYGHPFFGGRPSVGGWF